MYENSWMYFGLVRNFILAVSWQECLAHRNSKFISTYYFVKFSFCVTIAFSPFYWITGQWWPNTQQKAQLSAFQRVPFREWQGFFGFDIVDDLANSIVSSDDVPKPPATIPQVSFSGSPKLDVYPLHGCCLVCVQRQYFVHEVLFCLGLDCQQPHLVFATQSFGIFKLALA